MKTIEIDFDVYKALIIRRETEEETFNDVLRELLGLAPARTPKQASTAVTVSHPWVSKGVSFTHGTEFRATYNLDKGLGCELIWVQFEGEMVLACDNCKNEQENAK